MPSAARADPRNAFYVPAATIWLGAPKSDLLRDHGLAVTQVEVDLQLSAAGLFKFTITNCFDVAKRDFVTAWGEPALDLLKLGTRVWIKMGYGDKKEQPCLLSGYINSVSTGFAEGGSPELEVSGQDALYPLGLGTLGRRLENKSLKDAVAAVAKDYRLTVKFGADPPSDVTLDSNMETDLQFFGKMVESFSKKQKKKWEFYSPGDENVDYLFVGPRNVDGAEIGELEWGVDLLSFKPEVNLGSQVAKVVVSGWNEFTKEEIVGEARAERGAGETGSELQAAFMPREVVRQLRLPVKSKQEADDRAAAELAKSLNDYVKGEGETFGFPELRPNTRIKLLGLGDKFSRSYYVTKTVHRYDASGYRTRFSIEEPEL